MENKQSVPGTGITKIKLMFKDAGKEAPFLLHQRISKCIDEEHFLCTDKDLWLKMRKIMNFIAENSSW